MGRPRKPKPNLLLAIAYLRVSTDQQTLAQQRDAIEAWAAARGVRIAEWFEDEDVSGAAPLDQRLVLLDAVAALRASKAGLLVAWKRDRLHRDVGVAVGIERLVADAGARIETADGVDSSDTPEGQFLRAMLDAAAQYERALICTRTRAALRAKSKRNEVVGGIPFGYAADHGPKRRGKGRGVRIAGLEGVKRLLVPQPHEQQALELMRRLRAAGRSYRAIVAALELGGHRPRGKRWHVVTVQRALAA